MIKMIARNKQQRIQIKMLCTKDCVPQEHLLRKIDAAVDFNKIYNFVEDLYCTDNGRRSVNEYGISLVLGIWIKQDNSSLFSHKLQFPPSFHNRNNR